MISSAKHLIRMAGIAASILLIPNGLFGQLTAAEQSPWVGDTPAKPPPVGV